MNELIIEFHIKNQKVITFINMPIFNISPSKIRYKCILELPCLSEDMYMRLTVIHVVRTCSSTLFQKKANNMFKLNV